MKTTTNNPTAAAGHTPLPWKQFTADDKTYASVRGANGSPVADCGPRSDLVAQANTELIVRAVNNHANLLAALQTLMAGLSRPATEWPLQVTVRDLADARTAIAKATEGTR